MLSTFDFDSFTINFCFFKHKTAYEMRISDWSSDVCSSDLLLAVAHVWTEAADVDLDLVTVRQKAELARQAEQRERFIERAGIDTLGRAQRREARFLLVIALAALHARSVAHDPSRHRAATDRINAQLTDRKSDWQGKNGSG